MESCFATKRINDIYVVSFHLKKIKENPKNRAADVLIIKQVMTPMSLFQRLALMVHVILIDD